MNPLRRYIPPPPAPRRFTPGMLAADAIGALIVLGLPFALLIGG